MDSTKKKLIAAWAVSLLIAFGAGRFAAPTKVVTKTQTVTQTDTKTAETDKDKSNTQTDKKNDRLYIRVETIMPDGTRKIETRILDKGSITIDNSNLSTDTKAAQTDTTTTTTTEKTVERSAPSITLSALAAVNVTNLTGGVSYGASVTKRILGPITVGGFGLSNGTGGVSLGVQF